MTIQLRSAIHQFAISTRQNNGSPGAWKFFPKGPTNYPQPVPMNEPSVRIDGTKQQPLYYNLQLEFGMLTSKWLSQISQLYDPDHQEIFLNYCVPTYLSESNNNFWVANGVGWRYSPAVWADPPRWGRASNINFYDCVVNFTMVEWSPIYF